MNFIHNLHCETGITTEASSGTPKNKKNTNLQNRIPADPTKLKIKLFLKHKSAFMYTYTLKPKHFC